MASKQSVKRSRKANPSKWSQLVDQPTNSNENYQLPTPVAPDKVSPQPLNRWRGPTYILCGWDVQGSKEKYLEGRQIITGKLQWSITEEKEVSTNGLVAIYNSWTDSTTKDRTFSQDLRENFPPLSFGSSLLPIGPYMRKLGEGCCHGRNIGLD
ncbi:hypothetical protein HAX54_043980 [Datura stramonium]|uniref:Uncharacterized protein n=1 Tax=Datura stramonium TaxID=4076 RepID=A0ABS8W1W5_DATST|nr:hypothetical protein [Datura stramonium]